MRKHAFFNCFCAVLLTGCLLIPGEVLNVSAAPETVADDSSEIIYISSTEDLTDLADHCHSDNWSADKTVELTQDILLSSDFTSIPIFNGCFKGNGHTISGYCYGGDGYGTGFFRYVGKDGIVEDLKIAGTIQTPSSGKVTGGIAGINYGRIRNCTYSGSIKSNSETGGIVGINESSGIIQQCVNNSDIQGYYFTGGIAGKNYGIIQNCVNKGAVNNTKEWVTEDDEKSPDILSSLRDDSAQVKLQSGTDTGGIAGMSKGFIRTCTNIGSIGYEHVGYNVGGIAGRQAGGVEHCLNRGKVLGRKDIGGIVGQMEPYIAITNENSVKNSIDTLHESINTAINDVDDTNDALTKDMNELQYYSDQSVNAGNELYDNTRDYINTNTEAANRMITRISGAISSLNRIVSGSSMENPEELDSMMSELKNEIETNETISEADRERARIKYDEAQGYYNELQASLDRVASLEEQLAEETDPLNRAALEAQLEAERINAQSQARKMQGDLGEINSILSTDADLQLVQIDRSLDSNVDDLHSNLNGMSEVLKRLSSDTSQYSKTFTNDLRKINDNLMTVYDTLDTRVSELTGNDGVIYTDVSDLEILTATLGKVSFSTNNGTVEGDINIGGITGSMAIDTEDPEGNAAGNVNKNLDATYTTQNIIHECTNGGYITAKNDGAGGIAGFMRQGVINASKGFGSVTSTGGNYVGGICGQSLSMIKDSYVLSTLSGGDYVGGIAGFGTTLKNCCSMPSIIGHTGRYGALCGQIQIDADTEVPHLENVTDNYYVSEYMNGIDNIDYKGSIDKIDYETMISLPDVPYEFRNLRIIFRADGEYAGLINVKYGDPYGDIVFPDVPARDGYYGTWSDTVYDTVQGNLVLDAEYTENITVLKSSETDTKDHSLGYIDDAFDSDATLSVELLTDPQYNFADSEDATYYLATLTGAGADAAEYRLRLLNPYETDVEVYRLETNAPAPFRTPVAFLNRGSYIEVSLPIDPGRGLHSQVYCIVKQKDNTLYIVTGCVAAAAVLLLVILSARRVKKIRKQKKENKQNTEQTESENS